MVTALTLGSSVYHLRLVCQTLLEKFLGEALELYFLGKI